MVNNTNLAQWHALIEPFRSFGGIANNVIQREGNFGLGLFPIDPSQPVELRVPNHLLVSADNLTLLNGTINIKDAGGYPEGFAEWYANFQANYSWGADGRRSIKTFEDGLKSLPDSVQQQFENSGLLTIKRRYPGINEEQDLFQRFIATRQININGRNVLMPIIELVNHSPTQSSWIIDKESIAIEGKYNSEILVRYSIADSLRRYIQYGFNCKEHTGFSLNLTLIHNNQKIVVNGGINFQPFKPNALKTKGNTIIINQPLMSSSKAPRIPRKLFEQTCQGVKINAKEVFDLIHQKNKIILINIFRQIENLKGDAATNLKTSILNQIEALSYYYGCK